MGNGVVHLVATPGGWGGLERVVCEMATEQHRRGDEVMMVASEEVLSHLPEGVPRAAVDFRRSRWDPRLIRSLTAVIREAQPAILHGHANKGARLVRRLRGKVSGLRTVATIHNTKKHVKPFAGQDAVIAVSRKAGESLQGIPHTVVWNGLPVPDDPAVLPDDIPERFRGGQVVGAYARFVEAKGFDLLLEALAPLEDVTLWLAGDGPLRPALEEQARKLGMADRVWFPGFRRDAEELMTGTSLFVLPSRHEGFPLTLIEMLHRRVPVVAARVAGAEEIMPEAVSFEIGDVEGMRERIREALAHPEGLRSMMLPVFELAATKLTIANCCEETAAVYRSVLER